MIHLIFVGICIGFGLMLAPIFIRLGVSLILLIIVGIPVLFIGAILSTVLPNWTLLILAFVLLKGDFFLAVWRRLVWPQLIHCWRALP
jgi:hypothetical protein